jgi:NitT/TauT family transport system permease protein
MLHTGFSQDPGRFAHTLTGSLLAGMFASQRGLGYLLMNGIGLHNVELIMSVTLVIVVFAFAVSALLLYIDQRLHRRA